MGKWKIVERDGATGIEKSCDVETFNIAIRSVLDGLNTPSDRVIRVEGPNGENFGRWWFERRYALDKPKLDSESEA